MTRPSHINPNCHCGAPLRPRVEVFANADADEWVCSAGCTDGVFFDWTEAQLAALHLDDASVDRAWEGALAEIRAEGGDPDAMVARAAETLAYYRANPAPSTYDPLATICADIACNTEHRAPADVRVNDVLRCPACGTPSRAIDTGREQRVEYIRARALNPPKDTVDKIAKASRIAHAAAASLCRAIAEPVTPWNEGHLSAARNAIEKGWTGRENHEAWLRSRLDDGWAYGATKNVERKASPALVGWDSLPQWDRIKGDLFADVARQAWHEVSE